MFLTDVLKKLRGRLPLRRPSLKRTKSAHHDFALLQQVRGQRIPKLSQLRNTPRLFTQRERLLYRASLLLFIFSLAWFGWIFSARYRTEVPKSGGRYIEAVVGSPKFINPLFAPLHDADMDIVRLVYSGLMRIDAEQRFVPDLAASYTVSEDKKVYTFSLRKDAVWHDGEPFTSGDVLYTFDMIRDNAVGSPLLATFAGVDVETPDPYTVRFTLPEPFSPFLSSLTVGILPRHIWSAFNAESLALAPPNLQPIGTGPFAFQKFVKDHSGRITRIELSRFDRYYRQTPYVEEFVFEFFTAYEGDGEAIEALRNQSVDAIHFVPSDLKEKIARKHTILHTLFLPQYTALFFNQEREAALKDSAVREALGLALDKERILRESLQGEGMVLEGPLLPGSPGYSETIEKTAYNQERANELLDASWSRVTAQEHREKKKKEYIETYRRDHTATSTPEGESTPVPDDALAEIEKQLDSELNEAQTFYRKNKDGKILEIELLTTETGEYRSLAERIAGFWQDIGVSTRLTFVGADAAYIKKDILKDRAYDVLLYGVLVGSDPDQYPFWHSSQAKTGLNLSGFANVEADMLLEEAREAKTSEEMATAYEKFQKLLLEKRPAIFLYMPTYTYATTDKIHGQTLSRIFTPSDRFADIIYWYFKTKNVWTFND